jgi:hypothetical protein
VDTIGVDLDVFTAAIIDVESPYYDMAHYTNAHLIIFYRFNEIISLLFEMELDPSRQALVTPTYTVECIFYDDNYMFTASLLTSVPVHNQFPPVLTNVE